MQVLGDRCFQNARIWNLNSCSVSPLPRFHFKHHAICRLASTQDQIEIPGWRRQRGINFGDRVFRDIVTRNKLPDKIVRRRDDADEYQHARRTETAHDQSFHERFEFIVVVLKAVVQIEPQYQFERLLNIGTLISSGWHFPTSIVTNLLMIAADSCALRREWRDATQSGLLSWPWR